MRSVQYKKLLLATMLCWVATLTAVAQHTNILNYFQATENNGKVTLNWQIFAGSTCSGIQIYHSADSINFTQIGEIIGVCGSFTEPVNYSFTDESPQQNGVNYYQLALGTTGKSITVSIKLIDITSTGYQIRPHPLNGSGYIYFDNTGSATHQLTIYNAVGHLLATKFTSANYFVLESTIYSNGLYFFAIANQLNQIRAKGKLLVAN